MAIVTSPLGAGRHTRCGHGYPKTRGRLYHRRSARATRSISASIEGSLPENTAEGQPRFWQNRAQNFRKKLYVVQNRMLLVPIQSEITAPDMRWRTPLPFIQKLSGTLTSFM